MDNRAEIEYKLHQIDLHISDICRLTSEIKSMITPNEIQKKLLKDANTVLTQDEMKHKLESEGFTPPVIAFNEMEDLK